MEEVVSAFAGESTDFDLEIKADDIPDENNTITLGETSMTGSKQFTITLNSRYLDLPSLDIARTLLHEAIHAEMKRKIASVGGEITTKNFPGIYDYYTRYGREGDWSHQQMAAHYINTIVNGLQEYDNNQHSESFYESIAWKGLQGTTVWNQLSTDQQEYYNSEYQVFLSTGSKNCQ